MVQRFVDGYERLFGTQDEEDDEEGEEQGSEGEDDGSDNSFGGKWRWVALVDRVSETVRDSWEKVIMMNVYEFFNIVSYSLDKATYEKQQIEKWKRKN